MVAERKMKINTTIISFNMLRLSNMSYRILLSLKQYRNLNTGDTCVINTFRYIFGPYQIKTYRYLCIFYLVLKRLSQIPMVYVSESMKNCLSSICTYYDQNFVIVQVCKSSKVYMILFLCYEYLYLQTYRLIFYLTPNKRNQPSLGSTCNIMCFIFISIPRYLHWGTLFDIGNTHFHRNTHF